MTSHVKEITSEEEFIACLKNANLAIVHFYAEWASECQPMNEVLNILASDDELKEAKFFKILAESYPKISLQYKVSAVPTFLVFICGKEVGRLDGANAAKLTLMVKSYVSKAETLLAAATPMVSGTGESAKNVKEENLEQRLKKLINQSDVMLFMKGNPQNPQCGFSRQAVALLGQLNCQFGSFDILEDESVRQGLKTYSNWPTFPQLYVNGELVGGLDIMKEMVESGDLQQLLQKQKEPLENRLKSLINKAPLMVFMKGNPNTPRCGFSRQLVDILNETLLPYETFDILGDEEVRQGLKTFSNWPTYPQVYVKGNLVGGLDIIKELKESGELISTLKGD